MQTKILRLLLIALILSGCASTPSQLPDWKTAELPEIEATNPLKLPLLCGVGEWDTRCWKALEAYEIVAEANFQIGLSNVKALKNTEAGYSHLIQAGILQTRLTEFYMDELKREERGRFIDGLFYKTLIGLGIIFLP